MYQPALQTRRDEWRALIGASLLLASVALGIAACGSDDLVFPGDVPATATSNNTATPTPDN